MGKTIIMTLQKTLPAIVLLLTSLACAQRVVPLDYFPDESERQSQLYFKDINDDMLEYEGTWLYEQGGDKFVLVLERVQAVNLGGNWTYDKLMGNYQYIKDWVEIINTLGRTETQGSQSDIYHFESLTFRKNKPVRYRLEDPVNSKWTSYTSTVTRLPDELLSLTGPPTARMRIKITTMITDFNMLTRDPEASQRLRIPKEMILTKID